MTQNSHCMQQIILKIRYIERLKKNWDSLHASLNSHNKASSYKKKNKKMIKAYWKPLQNERTVNRCLLILDL